MSVAIVGMYGCGKSTLARRLAAERGLRYVDVDEIYWTSGRSDAVFGREIARLTATPGFVTDGLYASGADVILTRADEIVWLDLPFPVVAYRVFRRARAGGGGGGVWDGTEVQSLPRVLRPGLAWRAWRAHAARRRALRAILAPHSGRVVRLTTRAAVDEWCTDRPAPTPTYAPG